MTKYFSGVAVLCAAFLCTSALAQPTISTTPGLQMRILSTNVTANGAEWDIDGVIDWDNSNTGSFRAWWGFEVSSLNTTTGETLNFDISGSTFSGDFILPVYSIDNGATFQRVTDDGVNGPFEFTIDTPPGVSSIRVYKYYPYTLPQYAAYQASIRTHPYVTEEESTETTTLGNKLYMYTITDPGVPLSGKRRVWVHSAVHPSENTAHFKTEGLIDFLLGGTTQAENLLDAVIFHIVPVANPDGIQRGNYRTNADSVNLENEWSSPYNSSVPEIEFLRRKLRELQGTSGDPAEVPIEILFNLHSSHGQYYPFHFVHDPTWSSPGDFGVKPSVRALEDLWVDDINNRSDFMGLQGNFNSSLGGSSRPFVEGFMHDEYSIEPQWPDVMAITVEGGYQLGPTPGVPNTPDDYRDLGRDMGLAIGDYFNIDLDAPLTTIGDWWMLQ